MILPLVHPSFDPLFALTDTTKLLLDAKPEKTNENKNSGVQFLLLMNFVIIFPPQKHISLFWENCFHQLK